MLSRWRQGASSLTGTTEARVDEEVVAERLGQLGIAGDQARALDRAVDAMLTQFSSLSELTSALALGYLERIRRPLPALTLEVGVLVISRTYMAHLAVEADPAAYGADDVPVLGNLPPLRRGAPPQDLSMRVVKATRRRFELIRAVDDQVWAGLVTCAVRHAHAGAAEGELLDETVIDGLARFGWVLRQVDIHYGQQPG